MGELPPHDVEAEAAVLGAMLLEGEAAGLAAQKLLPEDFYPSKHSKIFRAICAIFQDGHLPDELVLREHLERHGLLDKVGGSEYIHALTSSVPSAANLESYIGIVKRVSVMRQVISAATATLRDAQDNPDGRGDAVLGRAVQRLTGIANRQQMHEPARIRDILGPYYKDLEQRYAHPREIWGLATGLKSLDLLTGGLQPSELVIVAARPSVGKTSLALTFLDHIAVHSGKPCVLFSLEMGQRDIVNRLVSMRTGVPFRALRSGSVGEKAWGDITGAVSDIQQAPLWVEDAAAISLPELAIRARLLRAKEGVEVVIVDYLQIMSPPKAATRDREVAQISGGLKALAKELDIPVVALSQLRRLPAGRDDHGPGLMDLRDSGALEQDADLVVILHRKRDQDGIFEADGFLDVAKHRNGPTGTRRVMFQPDRMRFVDAA